MMRAFLPKRQGKAPPISNPEDPLGYSDYSILVAFFGRTAVESFRRDMRVTFEPLILTE